MPDLDLSALRKVAEAGRDALSGGSVQRGPYQRFQRAFDPPTVLALLDELERLRKSPSPIPLTSMSNAALRSIADDCERIISGRNEDGVFS